MSQFNVEEYQNLASTYPVYSMEEKEKLFKKYQEGDSEAMMALVESYFGYVIEYVIKLTTKKSYFDAADMIKYINSCLFQRMQICTSIHSYEKDSKRLIQREASRYLNRIQIKNKKENFDFIDLEINEKILKVLKDSLEPDIYYVFYQMVSGVSIEEISEKLNIDLYEIKKRYVFALEMLETFLASDEKRLKRRLYSIKEREGSKGERIKITPYSIDSIVVYFYLKDTLTELEQKLYYYQVFSKYAYYTSELCAILKVSEEELVSLSNSLNAKIQSGYSSSSYGEYKDRMIKHYGPYLYNLVKSEKVKKFDFSTIKEVVGLLTFDDIKKFLADDFPYITANEKKLLYKYFYRGTRYTADVEDIERDVNLNLFGFKRNKNEVDPMKYYQTYLDHIDEFDSTQRMFLECFYFKTRDKRDFVEAFPNSPLYYRHYDLIERLEKLYYNVNNFCDNSFNREKWLSIRDKYSERHTAERVKLLDWFYGVNGEPLTIKEIRKFYPGLSYVRVHDMVSDAREAAVNVYINKKHRIEITKEDYLPFLDEKYDYTDQTREILTMFLRDGLDYAEISKRTGLNKTRISNIITDGVRKIDHYRLGILHIKEIDAKTLGTIYKFYGDNFTDEEKEMHRSRFVYGNSNDAVAIIMHKSRLEVNRAMTHLYRAYDRVLIKKVTLTEKDVRKEVKRHFTDTVLSERSRKVLALYYGVKTKDNPTGEKHSGKEIQTILGISNDAYFRALFSGQEQIKLRKIGAEMPDMYVFPRKELVEILKDRHLPISEKERFIINSLFALNGTPYKSCNELGEVYQEQGTSIRRRYYRAMVSIKKYLNGELDEQIDYETDIVPILKYFSKSDRVFMHDFYKEHTSYEAMGKKYGLSMDMVLAIMNRIKVTVFELTHGKINKMFDFDYYYEAIDDPNLPFYGDLETARQIFELYFGMNEMRRLSIPEIKERLNLDLMTSAINRAVYSVMISVCKLREGIKKPNEFTYEEIVDYYMRHKEGMEATHRVYYDRYFKRMSTSHEINGRKTKVSEMITYDLLKERERNLFRLETATKEEIARILANDGFILDSKNRQSLNELIHPYGELHGRDINHVYRIINSLLERNLLFVDKGKSYRLRLDEQ